MPSSNFFLRYIGLITLVFLVSLVPLQGQENEQADSVQKKITEPIHRVPKVASNNLPSASIEKPNAKVNSELIKTKIDPSKSAILPSATRVIPDLESESVLPATSPTVPPAIAAPPATPAHPLDEAIAVAYRGLKNCRENIRDYSAILVKRERVNGELLKPEYAQIKVRSRIESETGNVPLSIYMKFLKPRHCCGREVIWIEGQNENKICVHEGSGIVALKRFNLDPCGWLAMQGQRYPIYEAGIENLIVKLIEKAERDRNAGDCEVIYRKGAKLNGRTCSTIEVTHPVQQAPYDFYKAKVFIDDELKIPIRYSAHHWPVNGGKPQLFEEYTYLNVQLNQGFTDEDFDPNNAAYNYPRR